MMQKQVIFCFDFRFFSMFPKNLTQYSYVRKMFLDSSLWNLEKCFSTSAIVANVSFVATKNAKFPPAEDFEVFRFVDSAFDLILFRFSSPAAESVRRAEQENIRTRQVYSNWRIQTGNHSPS